MDTICKESFFKNNSYFNKLLKYGYCFTPFQPLEMSIYIKF
jgi:hypothetical protein